MKVKNVLICMLGLLILCIVPSITHGAIKLSDNFSFYGFLKLDAFYQDSGMNSVVAPRYAKPGDGHLTLSALNSRFGFKWVGKEIGSGWKIGGHLEFDLFDGSSANQMKFRTRHANFTLTKGSSKLLFGQFWDLFSPIGPTTLNTNGYFWQVGNVGFRRAQVRYTNSSDKFEFAVSANDPTSTAARKKQMPIIEGRLGVKLGEKGKIKIGVSGAYGQEAYENDLYENNVDILGVGIDWTIPFSQLTIKGEFTTGENLAVFLTQAGVLNNAASLKYEGKKVNSFWSQLVYSAKKLSLWGGYSFEKINEDYVAAGDLNDKSAVFAGIKCIAGGGVSFGAEYTYYLTKPYMGDEDFKTSQLIVSCIYSF